jgi:hypothetical protein
MEVSWQLAVLQLAVLQYAVGKPEKENVILRYPSLGF